MGYCYQKPLGALDAPGFEFPLMVDIKEAFKTATFGWYFTRFLMILFSFIDKLPRPWVQKAVRPTGAIFAIQDVCSSSHAPGKFLSRLTEIEQGCKERISALQAESQNDMSNTVFRTALHPDSEKNQPRLSLHSLTSDAVLFFLAGTDTTAHTLTLGTWCLTKDPQRLAKLQADLDPPFQTALRYSWAGQSWKTSHTWFVQTLSFDTELTDASSSSAL